MSARLRAWAQRPGSLPVILLAVVVALSLTARLVLLDEPCQAPCRSSAAHLLVFDEDYYVNAARVIAGIRPPHGYPYASAPLGVDPNAEHPPLAKLVMAGSIELFGDGPFAWRIGSILMGTVAILGMFALVRAAGGDRWLALAAAALMAADNLQLVHARIATLDVYALAAMIWGAVLYVRNRPVLAGVVIGVGACAKEVAPYVLIALALLEVLRWWLGPRRGLAAGAARILACTIAAAGVFVGLLAVLDRIAPPYADASHQLVTGGVFGHIAHIVSYAAAETSPHGPKGIASYPWQWLFDFKPISYLTINPAQPGPGLEHVHPAAHFLGMISPPILLFALAGLVVAGLRVWRSRSWRVVETRSASGAAAVTELAPLSLAWFLGTFLPFELASLIDSRTSYLYYMVIVMPGLYLAAVHLIERFAPGRRIVLAAFATVLIAAIVMYPFTPVPV